MEQSAAFWFEFMHTDVKYFCIMFYLLVCGSGTLVTKVNYILLEVALKIKSFLVHQNFSVFNLG